MEVLVDLPVFWDRGRSCRPDSFVRGTPAHGDFRTRLVEVREACPLFMQSPFGESEDSFALCLMYRQITLRQDFAIEFLVEKVVNLLVDFQTPPKQSDPLDVESLLEEISDGFKQMSAIRSHRVTFVKRSDQFIDACICLVLSMSFGLRLPRESTCETPLTYFVPRE